MKESYRKEIANHPDPESCAGIREDAGEALTGGHAGVETELRNHADLGADAVVRSGRQNQSMRQREHTLDLAQSTTHYMHEDSLCKNWEGSLSSADGTAERVGRGKTQTPMMNDNEQSDIPIVPTKHLNKVGVELTAESVEGSGMTKGNSGQPHTRRTQSRENVTQGLDRVRRKAKTEKGMKFTALLHHVTSERLIEAFRLLKRNAAMGIDEVTWESYAENLKENIEKLHKEVHNGSYRPKPSRRVFIPKSDGGKRPLGIAALEDKIVQRAVMQVLNVIYEEDFLGFSYGFRPGRSQHQALDALAAGIETKKVNYVLDADIRGYFDAISHGWMIQFIKHRIGDKRIVRLIQQWLKAGVVEEGELKLSEAGSPQGAVISPLLANVYLHYVFDLWAAQWRKKHARGVVVYVRYADDIISGFQYHDDAQRFLSDLRKRFRKFSLALHPDKTRLIEFGRYAAERRRKRGERKPDNFSFLGFTHMCGQSRDGSFKLVRCTIKKRMRVKLQAVKNEIYRRMHHSVTEQGKWLRAVVQGYFNYHAVPGNIRALQSFRREVARMWRCALQRRSQHDRTNWARMNLLVGRWLPNARILHPWPVDRFFVTHPR